MYQEKVSVVMQFAVADHVGDYWEEDDGTFNATNQIHVQALEKLWVIFISKCYFFIRRINITFMHTLVASVTRKCKKCSYYMNKNCIKFNQKTLSVTAGNQVHPNSYSMTNRIQLLDSLGVRYIKIGIFDTDYIKEHKLFLKRIASLNIKKVGVLFADKALDINQIKNVCKLKK